MAELADVKKARVTVDINGVDYELIPSPDAIISLSTKYDGLAPLMAALGRMNVLAMADTVIAGLGLEGAKARDMLKAVASSNLLDLMPKLTEFAAICSNGGRPLRSAEDAAQSQESSKNPM
ncbi:hypothetical protein [Mesorhizobium sp.]|uniref:hypothetical protein n=1 Tax=Mesorhizobium sp. TaxID=1871066 RepID=UPI000FE5329D|nr:hypothetical protein [Mesorhizobium sp.]RWB66576.1 MAG: hypothetical protein EOQ49_28200 [Mesorhizobium sp.]